MSDVKVSKTEGGLFHVGESLIRPINWTVPVGRYAPSPTGRLHRGNLRTALLAHQQMEALGGGIILRLDDLDFPRVIRDSELGILKDLGALGLTYAAGPSLRHDPSVVDPLRQSNRLDLYSNCLEELGRQGLIYPCFCSRRDLREASAPHGPDGFIYPGTCRPRGRIPVSRDELWSRQGAWRFRTDGMGYIGFTDGLLGRIMESVERAGDFVVRRRDGLWSYQLASAVDDWYMGITHVLRGEDLLSSTFRQLSILEGLGGRAPKHWCHVPLVCGESGAKLSKRDGGEGLPHEAWGLDQDPAKWRGPPA
jgi:glutamyl-tRNA synthetase